MNHRRLNMMNHDIVSVIVKFLSLDDIFNCRQVCNWWRDLFKVPPMVKFTDHVGSIIALRRHDYVLQILAHGYICLFATEYCLVEVSVYPNTLFDGVPIGGFPIVLLRSKSSEYVKVLRSLFGSLARRLPIFWTCAYGVAGDRNRPGLVDYAITRARDIRKTISITAPGEYGYFHICRGT